MPAGEKEMCDVNACGRPWDVNACRGEGWGGDIIIIITARTQQERLGLQGRAWMQSVVTGYDGREGLQGRSVLGCRAWSLGMMGGGGLAGGVQRA